MLRLLHASLILIFSASLAQGEMPRPIFPPAEPWSGASEALQLSPGHQWATPGEKSGLKSSPTYNEALAWLDRLADASPQLSRVEIGRSPEGRPLVFYIADVDGASTPTALLANGKARVLAQGGIHSGEIDGLDAGMMLLRDMLVLDREAELLEGASLLFFPVFSVDGHARRSAHGRINQDGPTEMGWRVTAQNRNLNRDYAKAATPEMQALLAALREWKPDLYLDLHVTDGADYQYDITYGWNGAHAHTPSIAGWLSAELAPRLESELEEAGHIPGPLVFAADGRDPLNGIYEWTAGPRFSTGYGDAVGLPTVLLENHSLKPFRQRVLGTRIFIASCMRAAAANLQDLRRAIASDRAARPNMVPLGWTVPSSTAPTMQFKAIGTEEYLSPVSGRSEIRFNGKKLTQEIRILAATQPTVSVARPAAYLIPAAWSGLGDRLALHGIEFETLTEALELEVEELVLDGARLEENPFEGRARVAVDSLETRIVQHRFGPGSLRVSTDQAKGNLAILLLEPQSGDSYFQWGELLESLSRIEYVEAYMIEPLATKWMEEDPDLRARFLARLASDSEFAGDPNARLMWFYEQTPWYDQAYRVYPVRRLLTGR